MRIALAARAFMALIVAVFVAFAIPDGWEAVAGRLALSAAAWSIAESAGREAGRLYLHHTTKRPHRR